MRSFNLKPITVVAALIGLAASLSSASAQTLLFNYSKSWSYYDLGAEPPGTWKTKAYNEAGNGWKTNTGVFLASRESGETLYAAAVANGASINTSMARSNTPPTAQVATYYFRTHFTFNNATQGILLLVSNMVDDGAIFYLNGAEIKRAHMPAGAVTYSTYSGGTAVEVSTMGDGTTGSGGGYTEFSVIPGTNLVYGDNVIAVEVHDVNNTSSEVVFGMSMAYKTIVAPFITDQPDSVTVDSNSPVSLSVTVSGDRPMTYQWQRDNGIGGWINIAGAVNPTYSIVSANGTYNGNYRVTASNAGGSVTSSVASITVVADLTPLTLLSAVGRPYPLYSPYQVVLTFSENVNVGSANVPTNYVIKTAAGTQLAVSNLIGFPNGPTVVLRVAPWNTALKYTVTVNNVKDNSGNMVPTNSVAPLGFTTVQELIPMENYIWKRYEDGDLAMPNPGWTTNDWQGYLFATDPGLFYFEYDALPNLCQGNANTRIQLGPTAYYFQTTFNLGTVAPNATFELHSVIDDGAVIYLNGSETARYNMPAGPVSYDTLASSGIGDATCVTNSFGVTNLVSGVNYLAVEVHQNSSSSTDVVFGSELLAFLTSYHNIDQELYCKVAGTNRVAVFWNGPGFKLESTADFMNTNSWVEVPTAVNHHTFEPGATQRYYRLHRQ